MNEQEKTAYWERFREMGDDERLFEIAIKVMEFSSPDRPPCNRIARLTGNGRLGLMQWQFLWLGALTAMSFGEKCVPLIVKLIATIL